MLAELYAGEVLTASQAAVLCGASPSAMSYHLRALHRVGLIEPVPSDDGRERPWRKAADSFDTDRSAYAAAGPGAAQEQLGLWAEEITRAIDGLAQRLTQGHTDGVITSGRLWLTDEEEQELGREMLALWKRYADRTEHEHPAGASRRALYTLIVPE